MSPPATNWELERLEGDGARRLLSHARHLEAWQRLAERDSKSTWYQEPTFVNTWYAAYAKSHTPLLLLGRRRGSPNDTEESSLLGVLPLAIGADGTIVHAGAHQCEYHGWIADSAIEGDFPRRCIAEVMRHDRPQRWRWRYLPPGSPTDWIEELEHHPEAHGVAAAHWDTVDVPLLDVTNTDFIAARRRKRLGSYTRKLTAAGLRFKRVDCVDRAIRVVDEMAAWCDLRQGAANGDMPFADDIAKLPLHQALAANTSQAHVSALWLGKQLLAAHVGSYDGRELTMGVQGYDPAYGRYSPGKILVFAMADDLREIGGRAIDLTPGGDPWKEAFATEHRSISQLELVRRKTDVLRDRTTAALEGGARRVLARAGADTATLRGRTIEVRRRLTVLAGGGESGADAGGVAHLIELPLAAIGSRTSSPAHDTDDGALDAVLRHAADMPKERRPRFLAEVQRRLSAGWQPLVAKQAPNHLHTDDLEGEDDTTRRNPACVDQGSLGNSGLQRLAWQPPLNTRIDIAHLDSPIVVRGQASASAMLVPEDVLFIELAYVSDELATGLTELAGGSIKLDEQVDALAAVGGEGRRAAHLTFDDWLVELVEQSRRLPPTPATRLWLAVRSSATEAVSSLRARGRAVDWPAEAKAERARAAS